jgi:type I restriction enzyme S subunit
MNDEHTRREQSVLSNGLPPNWEFRALKHFLSFGNGKDHKAIEVTEGGYPVYGSGGLFARAAQFLYSGESVLFGRKGTIDKPLHVNEEFWTVDTMYFTRINAEVCARYVYYAALGIPFGMYSTNTALPSITQQVLGNHKLPCPPQAEQTQIAKFLDYETAKIDALIEKQQQLIALLKEKRQAVISHAVTKGLNPDAPMRDSGVEWLGEVPAHWEVLPCKRLFSLECHPAPANNNMELLSVYTHIGVRPRRTLEQKGNRASSTDGYWIVKRGDIIVNKLLAWMGAVGHSDYEGVTSPAYDILRQVQPLNPWFYHFLFRLENTQLEFKRWSRGIMEMRLRLYFDELGKICMPLPPVAEQDAIVEEIKTMARALDSLTDSVERQIALLQERRTALISAAVTGKIDVRGWSPPEPQPEAEVA